MGRVCYFLGALLRGNRVVKKYAYLLPFDGRMTRHSQIVEQNREVLCIKVLSIIQDEYEAGRL